MIPVLFIVLCYWACAGAVASVKAARANPAAKPAATKQPASAGSSTPATPGTAKPLPPNDVTFGQWGRSAYNRWKKKIRSALPGKHGGKKWSDPFMDGAAAAMAGAALFSFGFASGTAWAGLRITKRREAKQTQRPAAGKQTKPGGSGRRQRSGRKTTFGPWGTMPTSNTRTRAGAPKQAARERDGEVIDAEIVGDAIPGPQTSAAPSQFTSTEYADLVGVPELLARNPDTLNGNPMAEILTIHHLLAWAQHAFQRAVNVIEQSTTRAISAADRAGSALVRSSSAIARHEKAVEGATAAHQDAAQMEATAARFSTLRMDQASMTSIGVAITSAVGLAQAKQRHAEAEAAVAAAAATLAAAEQTAAETAQASAQAAAVHAEAVQNMHETVRKNQMPHAEALAATGVDAAHPSLLAAG